MVVFALATVGLNVLIVGAGIAPVTVKDEELVALPLPVTDTAIGPVVAAAGTVVWMRVFEEDDTTAAAPPKVTEFCEGIELYPEPRIVTAVPGGPLLGENVTIETWLAFSRLIDSRFPTAS